MEENSLTIIYIPMYIVSSISFRVFVCWKVRETNIFQIFSRMFKIFQVFVSRRTHLLELFLVAFCFFLLDDLYASLCLVLRGNKKTKNNEVGIVC